jgi:site-specific DNA-methyltransferase (adenine-specific)
MWEQLKRVIKPNGAIVLFGSQPFTSVLVCSNLKMYKHNWVWEKSRSGSAISAKHCPVKIHEDILVFCKNSPNYQPIMEEGAPYSRKSKYNNENNHKFGITNNVETNNIGTRFPKTIRFEKQNWSKQQQLHPTQKPVALMEYLIKTYSNEGETVLDFTMGSSTTAIASLNTNRNFIGIEKKMI